jgi:chromosome segregation ATPase
MTHPLPHAKTDLYNCDNPMHGYNCFHLEVKSALTAVEQKEWKAFERQYGEFKDLADIDEEMDGVRGEIYDANETIAELEDDLTQLYEYRRLVEKKSKVKIKKGKPKDTHTTPWLTA